MADEVEIAKNSMDVLNEVFQLGCTFSHVSKILSLSGQLASAFPVVGAILGLIGGLLPDGNHQEILLRFDQLSRKIDQVRGDIKDLKHEIRWDITEAQYGATVNIIDLGLEYCSKIGKASGKDEKMRYQERLKELCANQNCALALKTLFNAVAGTGLYGSSSILDKFYDKTEGDRPRISALATRLLRLVSGGMMVISTYETMMRGGKGAADVTAFFYGRLNEAFHEVRSVLDRCVQHFRGNMLDDLNKFLDEGGSNRGLRTEISHFMTRKYDWLENFVLVYNDMRHYERHCFNGFRVESLHRNEKCGIVFYRTKDETPRFSNRYDEAYEINHDVSCCNAREGYNNIVAKLDERGIGWTGVAVIRVGYDLWFAGTFSTKDATITGPCATAIILLK